MLIDPQKPIGSAHCTSPEEDIIGLHHRMWVEMDHLPAVNLQAITTPAKRFRAPVNHNDRVLS